MSGKKGPQAVVGGNEPKRSAFRSVLNRKKLLIAGAAVVVVVAVGVGILVYAKHDDKTANSAQSTQKAASGLKNVDVSYVLLDSDELTDKVNRLIATSQYDQAEKLIKVQKDWAKNSTDLNLLLAVQTAAHDDGGAKQTAQQISELNSLTPGDYANLGAQYENSGDKAQAIKYYQKAIDGYNKAKVGSYQSTVSRLQQRIKDLQS